MKISFLRADKPLTKEYYISKATKQIDSRAYLHASKFTSHTYDISNLSDFYTAFTVEATKGSCLAKGVLNKELNNESRAGSTDRNDTTGWICLDLDNVEGFADIDSFLKAIGLHDISYILQWSSSQGLNKAHAFSCHIFMLLNKEEHPQTLKNWLTELNYKIDILKQSLELTKSYHALSYTLDITSCQNGRIIYIAPPNFKGVTNPFKNKSRVELVNKKYDVIPYVSHSPQPAIQAQTQNLINEKRAELNLPKKKMTIKHFGEVTYMANPDEASVTGLKQERGFVYLNINGGDSWGYFHPEDDPSFIHNFKGEPLYKTKELLPSYWSQLIKKTTECTPTTSGIVYLAFRDFKTSDYYNGIYDTNKASLELHRAKSETQLRHFMGQHGAPLGEFIPDWRLVFEPLNPIIVDPKKKTVNTYQPSDFYTEYDPSTPEAITANKLPATIHKVISHVLGDDEDTVKMFINWMAYILQNLDKTGTAWILQGTQGTGKGVLFHYIITPLLGETNVVSKRMEELESEFTGFIENKFVVFIDEIETGSSMYHSRIAAKLKNLIVEPTISIRKMYTPPYNARNFSNMIFASNSTSPVNVEPDDRRFNVGVYQTEKIQINSADINNIKTELKDAFNFFMMYKVDTAAVRVPHESQARDLLIHINRSSINTVSDALIEGDLEFFKDYLPDDENVILPQKRGRYESYKNIVSNAKPGDEQVLTRHELFVIFDWTVGNMSESPTKFSSMLKHHRLHIKPTWNGSKTVRGIKIKWI